MARIGGIDLPKEKCISIGLGYIYGIGRPLASKILQQAGVDPQKRTKALTDEEISKITQVIQTTYKVEGDLRREVTAHIKRLIDVGTYRGTRHKRGLPVRGQRTRTNARSRKGPRPRVGVRKKTRPVTTSSPRTA